MFSSTVAQEVGADEVLSFDMGGTTAKVCLIDAFRPQLGRRFEVARMGRFRKGSGLPLRIPCVELVEIGAGPSPGRVAAARLRGSHAMSVAAADTIRNQVMWNRLNSIVEEQAQALMRASFSPAVREGGDLAAGIFDLRGRMMAQAVTGTPGHVNTMAAAVPHVLRAIPAAKMRPGDAFITNDPWIASGHLHDVTIVTPAYDRGSLVGYFAALVHIIDVGGLEHARIVVMIPPTSPSAICKSCTTPGREGCASSPSLPVAHRWTSCVTSRPGSRRSAGTSRCTSRRRPGTTWRPS